MRVNVRANVRANTGICGARFRRHQQMDVRGGSLPLDVSIGIKICAGHHRDAGLAKSSLVLKAGPE